MPNYTIIHRKAFVNELVPSLPTSVLLLNERKAIALNEAMKATKLMYTVTYGTAYF